MSETEPCLLCLEKVTIIGLGSCNHKNICHICTVKMRQKCKDNSCPICKKKHDFVILTRQLESEFQDFDLKELEKVKDFYFDTEEVKQEVDQVQALRCMVPQCKSGPQQSIASLKKHLRDQHYRMFCDVCLEHRTCVLSEQILYSQTQLNQHQREGDFDDDRNKIFYHPYCTFCDKIFYDEDKFKQHLNEAHINCSLCINSKYRYYRDHKSFLKHLKMSHYMCSAEECKDSLEAFQTQAELESHMSKVHRANDRNQKYSMSQSIQQHVGFKYSQEQSHQKVSQFQDKEGHDFENQFISLQQTKFGGIEQIDKHFDEAINVKDFYTVDFDERENDNLDHQEQIHNFDENKGHDKRKGGNKQQFQPKDKNPADRFKDISIEEAKIYRLSTLPILRKEDLSRKMQRFMDEKDIDDFIRNHEDLFDGKIKPEKFIQSFISQVGPKTGIRLLNFYLVTKAWKQKYIKQSYEFDDAFTALINQLPRKVTNFINKSEKYSDFFRLFQESIEQTLKEKISKGEININKRREVTMDRERIFQLTQILRRLKTREMGKLKFAVNFGLSIKSLEFIRQRVFTQSTSDAPALLHSISKSELIALYLYVQLCLRILKGEDINLDKKQVNKRVLHEFFIKHGDFIAKYKEESSESSEEEVKVSITKPQNGKKQKIVQQVPSVVFNQSDFPSLPQTKPKPKEVPVKQAPVKHAKAGTWNNVAPVLLVGATQDEHALTKQIKKEFPTLGAAVQQPPQQKQKQQVPSSGMFVMDESFLPLPGSTPSQQTLREKSPEDPEEKIKKDQEIGVIKKKGKKKAVVLGGGFK